MVIAVIPPNTDVANEVVVVTGYTKSHVEKFCKTYFEGWERTKNITQFKYRKDIYLNSQGKTETPLVTISGGLADYEDGQVTLLDFDVYEGI
jgi:hypothetical protein